MYTTKWQIYDDDDDDDDPAERGSSTGGASAVGGSGGMLPREILKFSFSKTHIWRNL